MKMLLAILPTIMFTAYGQIIGKWRVTQLMASQENKLPFSERILSYITDPYIISAYVFSFLSSFAWLYVIEKYPVSIAFPTYIGILFVVVLIGSAFMLREPISTIQLIGIGLIMSGVLVASYAHG